jgi:hypothetical protein
VIKAREILSDDDAVRVSELAAVFHDECDRSLSFDKLAVVVSCQNILRNIAREWQNCFIVHHDDLPIGFAVGECVKYYFSNDKYSSLTEWYVLPSWRHTRAAFELMHTYENWSRLNGASRIVLGAARQGLGEVSKINEMFRRRGFTEYGALFYRDV